MSTVKFTNGTITFEVPRQVVEEETTFPFDPDTGECLL